LNETNLDMITTFIYTSLYVKAKLLVSSNLSFTRQLTTSRVLLADNDNNNQSDEDYNGSESSGSESSGSSGESSIANGEQSTRKLANKF
jgi:hypothetical protein